MPLYVSECRLTEKGAQSIKSLPEAFDRAFEQMQERGDKGITYYLVMGEYDFLVIWEARDDAAAAEQLLRVALAGTLRTTTLKAFTPAEFAAIVATLPDPA